MGAVIVGNKEGYIQVTLNRPQIRNAINFEVMEVLERVIEQAKTDMTIRALVITGAGDVFCSGGDLSVFHSLDNQQDAYRMLSRMGNILYELATLPKPVFAFINGPAVGGGIEIAAACDLRYVKAGTLMGFIQIKQGITTGWGGGTLLLEKVPETIGLEWLMSGKRFSAEEAYSHGFVNEILSEINEKTINRFIEPIIKNNIEVLTAYKNIAIRKRNASELLIRMQEEIKRCSELWELPPHLEAVKRFRNK